jgi:hypothetical protein
MEGDEELPEAEVADPADESAEEALDETAETQASSALAADEPEPEEQAVAKGADDRKLAEEALQKREKQAQEKEAGADKRFKEAAEMRKQAELAETQIAEVREWVQAFRSPTSIRAALAELGDEFGEAFDRAALARVAELHQQAQMTPEQRELIRTKRDLERERQERESHEKASTERLHGQRLKQYSGWMEDAMRAEGLATDDPIVRRMVIAAGEEGTKTKAPEEIGLADFAAAAKEIAKRLGKAAPAPKPPPAAAKPPPPPVANGNAPRANANKPKRKSKAGWKDFWHQMAEDYPDTADPGLD